MARLGSKDTTATPASAMPSRWALPVVGLLALLVGGCGAPDPETSYARAQASLAAHDYREVLIHARNVLQARSDHAEARVLLGRAALALGDLDEAQFQLQRAAQDGAPTRQHAVPTAELRARSGDLDAAFALLDSVPEGDRDGEYWVLRGNVSVQAGELTDAAAALSLAEAAERNGPSAALAIAQARLALLRSDAAAAAAAVRQAFKADPASPEAFAMSAAIAMERGDLEDAEPALETAAESYRQRGQVLHAAPVLMQLLQVQLTRQRLDAAEDTSARLARLIPDSAPAHYAAGLVALRRGDQQLAVDELRRAAVIAPGQADIDALLGGAYLAAGNLGQAEQHLLSAFDPARPAPTVVRLLAETRLRQGRARAALDTFARLDRQLVEQDPSLALLHGVAHVENGDPVSAIPWLELAVAGTPANPGATLQLARAYSQAGRADDAARLLRTSPTVSEDTAYATNVALLLERFQSDGAAAAAQFVSDLLAESTRSAPVLLVAATLDYLQNDKAAARRRAEEALVVNDGFVPALLMLATLESEDGRTLEAEAFLGRVLEHDRAHAPAALALARLRLGRDDAEGARAVLRDAAAQDETPAAVLAALGDLERQLGDLDRAGAIARDLQQRFPQRFEGFSLEARIHEHSGRPAEAARAYRAAYDRQPMWATLQGAVAALRAALDPGWEGLLHGRLETEPADIATRLLLADALQADSRAADALTQYEQVLALDEDNIVALNNAAWLLRESETERALRYAERAERLAPESAGVLDTLGWVLVIQGRAAEALPRLEKAAQSAPEALDIRYHLGAAQARSGDIEAARRTLEALLAEDSPFASRSDAETLLESL